MRKIITLTLAFLIFMCCSQKSPDVDRSIEDGVEVIVNYVDPYEIEGEPSNLVLEEEFRIGIDREDLNKLGLKAIWHFCITSDGHIYLTSSPPDVKLVFYFDQSGRFIKSSR